MTTTVEVQGRTLTLPMHIAAARAAGGVFAADAAAVRRVLPPGLQPLLLRPGRALVAVMAVTYLDNPLGDYDELVVAPLCRTGRTGALPALQALLRGRVGIFVSHMPVDQEFTREAGRTIWGYPKTLEDLELDLARTPAVARWTREGREVLALEVDATGTRRARGVRGTTYTWPDRERISRTRLRSGFRDLGLRPRAAALRLGPAAAEVGLTDWGFAGRGLVGVTIGHVEMTFETAAVVAGRP